MNLLREPLLHFFVLGGLVVGLTAITGKIDTERPDRIVVSPGQIERLAEAWERTWRRPPTAAELDDLIDDYIDEEVLYREALALDLDKDDTIIRRHLRQKMEFVAQDLAPPEKPAEETLAARLEANPDDYRRPARVSFMQIYFSPDMRGASTEVDATAALVRLNGTDPVDVETLGDALPLPRVITDLDVPEIDRVFGPGFAARLEKVAIGAWSGPLESGFGLHLVQVEKYTPARLPALDEVRDRLLEDWLREERERRLRVFLDALRERYDISVEHTAANASMVVPDPARPKDR